MLRITVDNSKHEPTFNTELKNIEAEFELYKIVNRLLHNEGAFTAYIEDTNTATLYIAHTSGELKAIINAIEVLELLKEDMLPF